MNRAHMLSSAFDGWVFCVLFQEKKKRNREEKNKYGGILFYLSLFLSFQHLLTKPEISFVHMLPTDRVIRTSWN